MPIISIIIVHIRRVHVSSSITITTDAHTFHYRNWTRDNLATARHRGQR